MRKKNTSAFGVLYVVLGVCVRCSYFWYSILLTAVAVSQYAAVLLLLYTRIYSVFIFLSCHWENHRRSGVEGIDSIDHSKKI